MALVYDVACDVVQGWKAAMTSPRPASGRQGMLLPVENDKWQLILTGAADFMLPSGSTIFARSVSSPRAVPQ